MEQSLYLESILKELRGLKGLVEKALGQVSDENFFRQIDPESNSIAIIVKHLAGSMRSRWKDFLTTDGEKPDRDRDGEFLIEKDNRAALEAGWREAWELAFAAIEALAPGDLEKQVRIRGEAYTVTGAIARQHTHIANHAGQIIFLAKHFAAAQWQTVTIPRNRERRATIR
jgi:hypothetical protein